MPSTRIFKFYFRRTTPTPDGSFIHLIGIRRLDTFLHEHAFYFIQCVGRALRSGFVPLDAHLRSPLHFPRSPTADRSLVKSDKTA